MRSREGIAADTAAATTRNGARNASMSSIGSSRMDKVVYLCSSSHDGKDPRDVCAWFLLGCGAKNRAADDTTSADAIKTPATVEQAAGSSISQRSRSWTVRSPPSRVTWPTFPMSRPAIRRKPWNSNGKRSARKAGKNCRTAPSATNRPARCSRVTGSSSRSQSFPLKRPAWR